MAGTCLKNLRKFEKLCGQNALQNVILTTTMWDLIDIESGLAREGELRETYWKAMICQGCTTVRYQNALDSAWDILDHFLQ